MKILVSQIGNVTGKSPYEDIQKIFKADIIYHPFFVTEIIDTHIFRQQKVNISEYDGVVLRSKKVADFFFEMVKNMRLELPASFKYFCFSESIALYLQKHITYRKRKVFSGDNNFTDMEAAFVRHKDDKILLPSSTPSDDTLSRYLKKLGLKVKKTIFFEQKSNDLSEIKPEEYQIIVFYTPHGVTAFAENFPDFISENVGSKIACLSKSTLKALKKMGIEPDIIAGFGKNPSSITQAIELYLSKLQEC